MTPLSDETGNLYSGHAEAACDHGLEHDLTTDSSSGSQDGEEDGGDVDQAQHLMMYN